MLLDHRDHVIDDNGNRRIATVSSGPIQRRLASLVCIQDLRKGRAPGEEFHFPTDFYRAACNADAV